MIIATNLVHSFALVWFGFFCWWFFGFFVLFSGVGGGCLCFCVVGLQCIYSCPFKCLLFLSFQHLGICTFSPHLQDH